MVRWSGWGMAVLALAVALAGCSTCPTGCGPYIVPTTAAPTPGVASPVSPTTLIPTPGRASPSAVTTFNVRYNPWFEEFDEVTAVIAERCGPGIDSARIVDRPVGGTVLHPVELTIACGDPPPRPPRYRGEVVEPGELIQLR